MSWKDYKGLGPWGFTEQPNKWGYLNNPNWTEEPNPFDKHSPCGYWYKAWTEPEYIKYIKEGKFYCAFPSTGPVYYPAAYTFCEINVDTMAVVRTLEFPTMGDGYALVPKIMTLSDTYLYILCRSNNPGISEAPYLATVKRSDLSLVDYFQLSHTTDGGGTVTLDNIGYDLGISIKSGSLTLYCHAQGSPNYYAVYRKYLMDSNGIPVQNSETLFEDPENREAGSDASNLVAGEIYTFVGMDVDTGRLVKLVDNPFSRDSIFDNITDIVNEFGRCYGICYDYANGMIYMIVNFYIAGHMQKVVKVNASTMTLVDTLEISASKYLDIEAICDYPENGFIYISEHHNSTHVNTLYEIRISDFVITRSTTYAGCVAQSNALYPDAKRGYLYYCGGHSEEKKQNFYRFDLTTFADKDHIIVGDAALHWGITEAQSYHKTDLSVKGTSDIPVGKINPVWPIE